MIFKKLILKNFKSHVNTEIKFDKGVTLILGQNGAGKSSILEGINFALYKKTSASSLNDLINTSASDMKISLSFSTNGQEYMVTRTRNQSKSTAELSTLRNGTHETIVSGDKQVNNTIIDLLEMDADLFTNAIYVSQGEIDSFIMQKQSIRKQNIGKLLRLDNLEKSYKDIAQVISTYETKKEHLLTIIENGLSDAKKNLINKTEEIQANLDRKTKEMESADTKVKKIKYDLDNEFSRNAKYNELSAQKQSIILESDFLSQEIESMKESLSKIDESQSFINENDNLLEKIDMFDNFFNLFNDYDSHVSKKEFLISSFNDHISFFSEINDIANVYKVEQIILDNDFNFDAFNALSGIIFNDLSEAQKAFDDISDKIEKLLNEINIVKVNISNSEKAIENLKQLDGVCPVCQSKVDEKNKDSLIEDYIIRLNDDTEKLKKIEKKFLTYDNERDELHKMVSDKEKHLTLIERIKDDIEKISDLLTNISEEKNIICRLSDDLDALKEKMGLSDKDISFIINERSNLLDKKDDFLKAQIVLENADGLEQKLDDVQNNYHDKMIELDKIDDDIKFLNFNPDLLKKLQLQQSELQDNYYSLVKEVGTLENSLEFNEKEINNINDKLKEDEQNRNKIERLDSFIKFLKDIRELYGKDGLQKDIRSFFKPKIELYTQKFFNEFDFDYDKIVLSDDYDISLVGSFGENDISIASGGERIGIALALRLGIASALMDNVIETILLDEPTVFLDDFRKQEFINIIQKISSVPQMILITHDPELESAADNIIVVEKRNGCSIVN